MKRLLFLLICLVFISLSACADDTSRKENESLLQRIEELESSLLMQNANMPVTTTETVKPPKANENTPFIEPQITVIPELSLFETYLNENQITLTAREVQYNMGNNTDSKFILEGVAELSDYYNYGFNDWTDDYFCLEVYPDETYTNRWYIYCHRDSFVNLFDKALKDSYIYVQMICEIPSYVYQKNQGNLASLEYIVY